MAFLSDVHCSYHFHHNYVETLKDLLYVDPAKIKLDTAEHRALALSVAEEGIVMLKNQPPPQHTTGGAVAGNATAAAPPLLPLVGLGTMYKTIAVVGPNADNAHSQMGGYTQSGANITTVLDAIVRCAFSHRNLHSRMPRKFA
jgi:beta-glucosidase-like glycosyl hydrolase